LQDGLNKSWLDLIAAADTAGFPILAIEYEAGDFGNVTDDSNITGDDEFIIAPGRALELDGAHANRIPGADLSQLIDVIWTFTMAIAAVSRTPAYYLKPVGGSDVPSGEALKQLESGLVSRAKERQLIFGQAWADVMSCAYKLQQTFGQAIPEVDKIKVETQWQDSETRNDLTNAQAAQIHQMLGVPDEAVFAMLDYSPQDIKRFQAMKRTDQAARVATVAQTLQKAQAQQQAQANTNGAQVNRNGAQ